MAVYKHTGAAIRPFGLGTSEFSELDQIPEFHQAWSEVAAQVQREGGSALDVNAAKTSLVAAFSDLVSHQIGMKGADALAAAKKYVLTANTDAGALENVSGLLQAAQTGVVSAATVQALTGTLIGAAVIAGSVTAGVGAAIIGAVAVLAAVLESAGLFAGPGGTEVCPGFRCDPAPNWTVGCCCVWGDRVVSPQSPNWRKFPTESNPANAEWFNGSKVGALSTASGSVSPAIFSGAVTGQGRLIDVVFPEYALLVCESQHLIPGMPGEFQRAYFAAWKANKEYALNGLKAAPDSDVLVTLIRLWNRAHTPGTGYVFTEAPKILFPGPNCPPQFRAYEAMLVNDVLNSSDPSQAQGRAFRINTGPSKKVSVSSTVASILNRPTGEMSTGAKVVAGVAGTSLLAVVGLYAYSKAKGIAFDAAVSKLKHRFIAKENPLFLPESTSNLSSSRSRHSTSRGRRLAYRVRADVDPAVEAVILMPDGSARLYRLKRMIARFMPSHYQYAKIRAGYGEILVYADQLM